MKTNQQSLKSKHCDGYDNEKLVVFNWSNENNYNFHGTHMMFIMAVILDKEKASEL